MMCTDLGIRDIIEYNYLFNFKQCVSFQNDLFLSFSFFKYLGWSLSFTVGLKLCVFFQLIWMMYQIKCKQALK